jgi:cytochrome c oxidase cbb3-type subunit 3
LERNFKTKRNAKKVASYFLKGSNPVDPKAPDGEVWVDEVRSSEANKIIASI